MPGELRVLRDGKRVPVVAFFGTKGGVGKTTIARSFAELVALAKARPNVLIVDLDVHHRGMTVVMTSQTPYSCKTVHDYVASQNVSDVEAVNVTQVRDLSHPDAGKRFLIPASTPESVAVFQKEATIAPDRLLEILHGVVSAAVQTYGCDSVVVDCGPIVDPYTAAGAMLADRAFIIGQNEPISFDSLTFTPDRIREFYPAFLASKMRLIVNKVRGWAQLEERRARQEVFHAIPFTMEIIDISEGLDTQKAMQDTLFIRHIAQIVEKVFQADHPELIPPPEAVLPQNWMPLLSKIDRLDRAPRIRRLGVLRLLLPVGLLTLVAGGLVFYAASTAREKAQNRDWAQETAAVLKGAIAEATTAQPDAVEPLQKALSQVESADTSDSRQLKEAVAAAKEAGLKKVPAAPRYDSGRENIGIIVLLAGVVLSGIGLSCARARSAYLQAIQGLRKKGVPWMMAEMEHKRSARKIFDKLVGIAQALD